MLGMTGLIEAVRGLALSVLASILLASILLAAPLRAEPRPSVPCLTCARIVPACWVVVYRWTDYNLRSGPGNHMVITEGPPPSTPEMAQAQQDIARGMPKGMSFKVVGTSRIDCPEPVKAAARRL